MTLGFGGQWGCLVAVGPAKFLFSLTPFSLLFFSLYCVSAGIPFVAVSFNGNAFFLLCNFKLPSLLPPSSPSFPSTSQYREPGVANSTVFFLFFFLASFGSFCLF